MRRNSQVMWNNKSYGSHPSSQHVTPFVSITRDMYSELISSAPYPYMLVQDLRVGVIPYSYKKEPQVHIVPHSAEMEQLVCRALPSHTGFKNDLGQSVCNFIRDAVHKLVFYGTIHYEIVYYYDNEESHNIVGFQLRSLPPNSVKCLFGVYYQILPNEILNRLIPLLKRIVRIDRSRLFSIKLPTVFRGPQRYRSFLRRMANLTSSTFTKMAIDEMSPQVTRRYFDFSVYQVSQDKWIAKATRHLGWTGRGLFMKRSSEYYKLARHILFLKTLAKLREHMLLNLNSVLKRIGETMDFKTAVRMDGLPSPAFYDEKMADLKDGKLSFLDAWKLGY